MAAEEFKRKLTAILSADLADFLRGSPLCPPACANLFYLHNPSLCLCNEGNDTNIGGRVKAMKYH